MVKIVEWKEQIVDDHVKKYNLHHFTTLGRIRDTYSSVTTTQLL